MKVKKVLLVDDDSWLSEVFALVLKQHGYKVESALSAEKAMQKIDSFKPSAIILDFLLPGHSAPALLNELQSHSDTTKLPVILCTSLDMEGYDTVSLESYGVKAVLDKSTMTPEALIHALKKLGI